ncbi:MAG: hypothetical protein MK110_10905 [Fuerstiella sp.]|nr:hypothetical protein [Fuerstiella sp.]
MDHFDRFFSDDRNVVMDTNIFCRLNRNRLFYVACRVAFLRVFDSLLNEFISASVSTRPVGFLDRIPLLAGTAPQVQLALLLQTWQTLHSGKPRSLTVQEQVICFAAIGELADAGSEGEHRMIRRAERGPDRVDSGDMMWLTSRVRMLQIMLPFSPHPAVLQIETGVAAEDLDPVRSAGGVEQETLAGLLDLLGHWTVSERLFENASGLLTPAEFEILRAFFAEHPELIERVTA